jgi:UDP-2-acetamido-3-amino-2,3-dideoxy-glucuronate N-acetyltransferase
MNYFIHPTAVLDAGAKIGAGTKIWHFSHVMAGAVIGSNCVLGQNVFVAATVLVGDGVKVQNNVSLYDGVVLLNDVFVGPSVVFTNVRSPRSHIDRKSLYQQTLVGKGATIGANATILCGSVIGEYALVGAGSVVTGDVPPHGLVVGNPARQVGWVGKSGLTLAFDLAGEAVDPEDGQIYRLTSTGLHILGQN